MEVAHTSSYSTPVDQLLTYGEGQLASPRDWPNYLELGLGSEHIPDLIRMATDNQLSTADQESLEVWAPLHAWRTLGQLHAEAAIEPLLSLFETLEDDDWVTQELPDVFGMIGPAALPALTTYLADSSHNESALISAISCVKNIATSWPEARSTCVALLIEQLELFSENEPGVNGFLILALVELQAKEAAPLMERAFAADCVDLIVMGDWEDVQVELGLKSAEEIEQIRSERLPEVLLPSTEHSMTFSDVSSRSRRERVAVQKKAKSKMAKQSRKKNRKR
jgi:HEAT repeat protein